MARDKVGCKWRATSAGEKGKIVEDEAQINYALINFIAVQLICVDFINA